MNKGVTLAFQTMSPVASKNVERTNVSMQHYTDLMKRYNAADIPTYTELILGLPGETYRSFADGMNMLMEAGPPFHLCAQLRMVAVFDDGKPPIHR
jgi:radical SAM superfamily enzyme